METIDINVKPMGHCASIFLFKEGFLISYYVGPECSKVQHTMVEYWKIRITETTKFRAQFCHIDSIKLSAGTGNSVLIPCDDNNVNLIFSKFTKECDRIVDKWKYCDNQIINISLYNDKLIYNYNEVEYEQLHELLTRCAPIKYNGVTSQFLLPMYREKACYGIIYDQNFNMIDMIGEDTPGRCMQPTLWCDESHAVHSLSRNYENTGVAIYKQVCIGSKTFKTQIPNHNNSIIAINQNIKNPLIIYNQDKGRNSLVIGKMNQNDLSTKPLIELSTYRASYPNYCFIGENLAIVYTNNYNSRDYSIKVVIFSKDEVNDLHDLKVNQPIKLNDYKTRQTSGSIL